jgi:predicted metal-dependent HD superfamily phosphohydrolase
MFEIANEHNIPLTHEQVIAIWLHDIIYDIPAGEESNEELSAQFVEMQPDMSGSSYVAQIIRDTEKELPTIDESRIVIDLDLWDLSDKERFTENNDLIRQEYSHLTDLQWWTGRTAWLRSFLDRDQIFVSKYVSASMERDARENLAYEWGVAQYMMDKFEGTDDV